MTKLVEWGVFLAVAGGLPLLGSWLLELPFLPLFAIAVAAVLVNGFIATLEDDLPGGFNNPDGSDTPRYAVLLGRIGRWLLAGALGATAVFFAIAGLMAEARASIPVTIGLSLGCILVSAAVFTSSRRALWSGLLVALGGIGVDRLLR